MFSLTPTANAALVAARTDVGAPDDWGIRFYAAAGSPPGVTFDFVATPEPDDVIGGSRTLRTYVDVAVHRQIGDASVDFHETDGSPELVIRPYRDLRRT